MQHITLISAFTALVASVASPYINTRVARLQFNTSVLSTNRHKWIETLRDLTASLHSQLLTAAVMRQTIEAPTGVAIARDPELFRRVEELLRTSAKIELMLNPREQDHQQLNVLMQEAIEALRRPLPEHNVEERVESLTRKVIQVTQAILKQEWIRVKLGT